MKEALPIWEEVEQESGEKLLIYSKDGMLWVLDDNDTSYFVYKTEGRKISNTEIKEKYPRLKNLPDDLSGYLQSNTGTIMAAKSLEAFKVLSLKSGAQLNYSTSVKEINHLDGVVTLENGKTYSANHIVVTVGKYESQFFPAGSHHKELNNEEILLVDFKSNEGLPMCLSFYSKKHKDLSLMWGMFDGQKEEIYKWGYDAQFEPEKLKKTLELYFPDEE